MARYLVRPVFWRGAHGQLQRVTQLVDIDSLDVYVFAHRPRASENRLVEWLLAKGILLEDVQIGTTLLVPPGEGERLLSLAK